MVQNDDLAYACERLIGEMTAMRNAFPVLTKFAILSTGGTQEDARTMHIATTNIVSRIKLGLKTFDENQALSAALECVDDLFTSFEIAEGAAVEWEKARSGLSRSARQVHSKPKRRPGGA